MVEFRPLNLVMQIFAVIFLTMTLAMQILVAFFVAYLLATLFPVNLITAWVISFLVIFKLFVSMLEKEDRETRARETQALLARARILLQKRMDNNASRANTPRQIVAAI
jgi:membrane protein implicated in regulation of membrane protease activity